MDSESNHSRYRTIAPAAPDTSVPRLRDALPEYYRENPRELGAELEIAEELLGSVAGRMDVAARRLKEDLISSLRKRWFPPSSPAGGRGPKRRGATRRDVIDWLEERGGRVAAVWTGFEVRTVGVDRLQARRCPGPAAVVVWVPSGLSEAPRSLDLPPDLVPLRTRLQVVLPLSEEDLGASCHGRVVKARIVLDSRFPDATP